MRQQRPGPDAPDLPRFLHPHIRNYRSKAFSQLGPVGFARTDAVYRHGRDAACHWLNIRPEPGRAAVSCQSVQLFLTWLVHDSPSRHHTLARLRGAQAGLHPHMPYAGTLPEHLICPNSCRNQLSLAAAIRPDGPILNLRN
jgi:hypothetical protein